MGLVFWLVFGFLVVFCWVEFEVFEDLACFFIHDGYLVVVDDH